MAPLNWATYLERAVGKGHPTLSDTVNRALRQLLTESGYEPDASPFPGLMGPVFNVKAFGTKGDGVTDDTVAIQAAETARAAVNGTLVFPDGTYRAAELTINSAGRWLGIGNAELQFPSGISSGAAILKINTNPSTSDLADVIIEGLGFNGGDQQVASVKGIYARRTQRLIIRYCRFRKFQGSSFANHGYGIYASGYSAATPSSPYAWVATAPTGWSVGTRIEGCNFTDCGTADTNSAQGIFLYYHDGAVVCGNYGSNLLMLCFALGWVRRISIIGNEMENGYDNGIRFHADESVAATKPEDMEGVTCVGNVIRNVARDGIRCSGYRCVVANNISERNTLSGIVGVVMRDCVVVGNSCFGNANHGIQLTQTTVDEWGTHKNTSIIGNYCHSNAGAGIIVQGGGDDSDELAQGIRVSENQCGRNGAAGIRFWDGDSTCVVSKNTCFENGESSTAKYGIEVAAQVLNAGGIHVEHNRCYELRAVGPNQGIGIRLVANTGKTLSKCYVFFNDCSDHPNVSGFNGTAIRTTGSGGTVSPQLLIGNTDRNVTLPLRTGVANGTLQSGDVVIPSEQYQGEGYIVLTDAATIAVDAALGNVCEVTLGGNRTMGAPTNLYKGQRLTFVVIQDGTGGRTLAWNAAYHHEWGDTGNTAGKRSTIIFECYDPVAPALIQVGKQGAYLT